MFHLNMACHCGKSKTFSGRDVKHIISQIDGSGWRDRGWLIDEGAAVLPKGRTYGACPDHADDMNDPRSPVQEDEDGE